jgi:anthranilate phosphoribosyltransferase
MYTIDDGLVKDALVEALKQCQGREVAATSSTLLNRGKAALVVDACFEVANLVHPRYTAALLQVFHAKGRTVEDVAGLVTTCVVGVREARESYTPIVPHIAKVITDIVSRADALGLDVAMLKRLPLKIGKKWAPIASNCLRTVMEGVAQKEVAVNPRLLLLFKDEAVTTPAAAPTTSAPDQIELDIKLGAMWTFVRGAGQEPCKYVAPLIEDRACEKVIRNLQAQGHSEARVTCHRS